MRDEVFVRTTLTLEPDVASKLRKRMTARKLSLKDAVNQALRAGSALHKAARVWWERTLTQPRPVGLTWVAILGFVRISTHRKILENPMRPGEAIRRVRSWLAVPGVEILTPGEMHAEVLFRLAG